MKKTLIILVLMLVASMAYGDPHLVCNPTTDNIDIYKVELDGIVYDSIPKELDGGKVKLYYDLVGLSEGNHTVKVKAVNKWGESDWSNPFVFDVIFPSVPTDIAIK